jgi:hypothetical protein
VVRVTTKRLGGKARKSFLKIKRELDAEVEKHLQAKTKPKRMDDYQYVYYLSRNEKENAQ